MNDLNLRSIEVTPLNGDVRITVGKTEISVRSGEPIYLTRSGSEIELEVDGDNLLGSHHPDQQPSWWFI